MDQLFIVLVILCALGSGTIGGVFFAFSNFVMPALARIAPAEGIHAMQAINVTVVNRLFLGTFMGTGVAFARGDRRRAAALGRHSAASAPCSAAPPMCWARSW